MVNSMFKEAKLLSKEGDKEIKISPLDNYKHAKKAHFMAISKDEVNIACKFYPILFIKDKEDVVVPVALLGIKENENLFVNKPGDWDVDKYIPALIRAYPFSVTISQAENSEEKSMSIVYDSEYEGLNKKDGQRIFDDEGNPNDYGNQIIKFVQDAYGGIEMTKGMTRLVAEENLLKTVDVNIEKSEQKYKITGLMQIDTEKLNNLSDESLLKLTKSGAINLIYAHLISLSNFDALAKKIK